MLLASLYSSTKSVIATRGNALLNIRVIASAKSEFVLTRRNKRLRSSRQLSKGGSTVASHTTYNNRISALFTLLRPRRIITPVALLTLFLSASFTLEHSRIEPPFDSVSIELIKEARASSPAPSSENSAKPTTTDHSAIRGHSFETKYLNEVDTIAVVASFAPDAHKLLHLTNDDITPWITSAIRDTFSSQPWVNIKPRSDFKGDELKAPNVMMLEICLSARREQAESVAASLSVQFTQSPYFKPQFNFSPYKPVTYPFIVPSEKLDIQKQIKDGALFLVHGLPRALCARKSNRTRCSPDGTDK